MEMKCYFPLVSPESEQFAQTEFVFIRLLVKKQYLCVNKITEAIQHKRKKESMRD